jgi:phosphatidylglycerophosphate synthase
VSIRTEGRPSTIRVRLAGATLVIALALLLLADRLAVFAALTPALPTTAVGGFLGLMTLAWFGITAWHPFRTLGPANWVTVGRTALVALLGSLALEPASDQVAAICVVVASFAAAMDGWDGWLARRTGMSSPFGARFDMEIDALLILVLGVIVWRYGKAGAWVLLSGALRYLFVLSEWVWHWMRTPLPPSTRRKTVCVVQIVGLIVAVSPLVPAWLSAAIAATTLMLLTWSFAVDVRWLWTARTVPMEGPQTPLNW